MRTAVLFLAALLVGTGVGALGGALPVPIEPAAEEIAPARASTPAAAPATTAQAPAVAEIPFRIRESLAPHAMTCALPPGVCVTPLGQGARVFPISEARDLARLDIELSWTASTALTQALRMDLVSCAADCGEQGGYSTVASREGGSPLALALDSFALEGTLVLVVSAPDLAPGPGAAKAHTRQDFLLSGVVGVLTRN